MSINDWEPIGMTTDGFVFSKPEMREPVVDTRFNLALEFPGRIDFMAAKSVIINDNLPAGQMWVTEREIILSKRGWENLIARLKVMDEARVAVRSIVERVMADELAWLRGAGHDV